jgi:hypothetical protein
MHLALRQKTCLEQECKDARKPNIARYTFLPKLANGWVRTQGNVRQETSAFQTIWQPCKNGRIIFSVPSPFSFPTKSFNVKLFGSIFLSFFLSFFLSSPFSLKRTRTRLRRDRRRPARGSGSRVSGLRGTGWSRKSSCRTSPQCSAKRRNVKRRADVNYIVKRAQHRRQKYRKSAN